MTLPTTIDLPSITDNENEEDTNKYLKNLVNKIEDMYEDLAENTNGFIRNNADTDQSQWVPTINSTGVSGTITYTHQVGWSVRQGIYTEVWFDIEWTAKGSSTGKMYVDLPYKVANSDGMPFIGILKVENIAFSTYTSLFISATPNTYQGQIWAEKHNSAFFKANIQPSGRIVGHVRYIGLSDE